MSEYDDDYVLGLDDVLRPSKAAERKDWRKQAQEELDELADLYPEYADVLNEVRF